MVGHISPINCIKKTTYLLTIPKILWFQFIFQLESSPNQKGNLQVKALEPHMGTVICKPNSPISFYHRKCLSGMAKNPKFSQCFFPASFVQPKERRKREETVQLRKAFHLKQFNVKHQNNWTIKKQAGGCLT